MLTALDTVPIEVRSIRYSDRIESVSTRETGVKLSIESLIKKEVAVSVGYEGEPAEGYILAGVENALSTISVSGPESVVSRVSTVMAVADISGINSDFTVTEPLYPYDANNEQINDDRIILSRTVTEVKYLIYATKTIPISSGYSGNPSAGFGANGVVITEPSSVLIAGRGENFDDMEVIYVSPDQVSIEGATSDVTVAVNISDYLPSGVIFADSTFDPEIRVKVGIEANQHKVIDVPLSNITIDNLPDGYMASIVDIGGSVPVEIQGIGDAYDRYSGDLAIGKIDAATLVPRGGIPADHEAGTPVPGENDGQVVFDFPAGVSVVEPVTLMVIVDRTDSSSVMPAAGGAAVAE